MGRSQNSRGDLEMVGGGPELKWKVNILHKEPDFILLAPSGRKF